MGTMVLALRMSQGASGKNFAPLLQGSDAGDIKESIGGSQPGHLCFVSRASPKEGREGSASASPKDSILQVGALRKDGVVVHIKTQWLMGTLSQGLS